MKEKCLKDAYIYFKILNVWLHNHKSVLIVAKSLFIIEIGTFIYQVSNEIRMLINIDAGKSVFNLVFIIIIIDLQA